MKLHIVYNAKPPWVPTGLNKFKLQSFLNKQMNKLIALITGIALFYGCVKDKPKVTETKPVQLSVAKKVYIVNEGNFNGGNASVSMFDPTSGEVANDIYSSQNNTSLGDVAQSINQVNGNYYVVVNNSGKIVVCNREFKKTAQISGLTSPRYILPISNRKAYVSDLYANAISIVDLNTNLKTGSIPCRGKTEQMVLMYNKVFVCNYDNEYVYVINGLKDQVEDSIAVGKNASSLVIDKEDKLWVLSASRLSKIDATTNKAELVLNFQAGDSPFALCLNKTKDTLYYINSAIYRLEISATSLPSNPFIAAAGKNFYGLAVSPNDFNIYAADALDYVQRSNIYVFTPQGEQKNFFKAGINSNGFYFE